MNDWPRVFHDVPSCNKFLFEDVPATHLLFDDDYSSCPSVPGPQEHILIVELPVTGVRKVVTLYVYRSLPSSHLSVMVTLLNTNMEEAWCVAMAATPDSSNPSNSSKYRCHTDGILSQVYLAVQGGNNEICELILV